MDDRRTAPVRLERVGAAYRRSVGSGEHGGRSAEDEPTPATRIRPRTDSFNSLPFICFGCINWTTRVGTAV